MGTYREVHFGEIVFAEQVDNDKPPEGATLRTYTNSDGQEVERVFIETKDPDGHDDMADNLVDVTEGNWIITHDDGSVSVVHDSVFAQSFEAVE